jgi:hypothetical protein
MGYKIVNMQLGPYRAASERSTRMELVITF